MIPLSSPIPVNGSVPLFGYLMCFRSDFDRVKIKIGPLYHLIKQEVMHMTRFVSSHKLSGNVIPTKIVEMLVVL